MRQAETRDSLTAIGIGSRVVVRPGHPYFGGWEGAVTHVMPNPEQPARDEFRVDLGCSPGSFFYAFFRWELKLQGSD